MGRPPRRVARASREATGVSLYDAVRGLPLHVDGYYLEPLEREVARDFVLRRTVVVLHGRGGRQGFRSARRSAARRSRCASSSRHARRTCPAGSTCIPTCISSSIPTG